MKAERRKKKAFSFKRAIRIMDDFSVVIMEARRQWNNIFKVLKTNKFPLLKFCLDFFDQMPIPVEGWAL